ncbi:hypothetical protein GHT06_006128 [Daphnia sinensis]|uniref:DDE-1 domain-containing protein n=1 Tax=Daphnia sinensis TaxID=1820382 RepID=A0AAD5KFE1_9CRUS|nr:hypothetical protein GHT06_006365 [Daphnia sinensis]KAI9550734.1 hypothetical protein GHT06_006128 [Daphnia sinensis]
MDNHSNHIEFPVVKYAKDNGIILLTFPPHCSHKLQPLDVAVFFPFKRSLRHCHNEWLQAHPGQRIGILNNVSKNILSGFAKAGIWPFTRSIIPASVFSPGLVTDRPGKYYSLIFTFLNYLTFFNMFSLF